MKIVCENQVGQGIGLIPSSSPSFPKMRDEVVHHINNRPPGSPPPLPGNPANEPDLNDPVAAILWKGSGRLICSWILSWNFRSTDGQDNRHTNIVTSSTPSVLLPFGLLPERRQFLEYWSTIQPNSKRLLIRCQMLGSNADVRPPADFEKWKGGLMGVHDSLDHTPLSELDTVAVTLDAAFFTTGECAGPDRYQLFEKVTAQAAIYSEVASAAKAARELGVDDAALLASVEAITGPAGLFPRCPTPPGHNADSSSFRDNEERSLALQIARTRASPGDAAAVKLLLSWADAELPDYRRI
jgi:hypothetical protein